MDLSSSSGVEWVLLCAAQNPYLPSHFRNETLISLVLGALAAAGSLLGLSGNHLWPKGVIFPKIMTSSQGQLVSSDKGPVLLSQFGIFLKIIPTPKILVRSAGCSVATVSLYLLLPNPFTSWNVFLRLFSSKPFSCKSLSQNLFLGDCT